MLTGQEEDAELRDRREGGCLPTACCSPERLGWKPQLCGAQRLRGTGTHRGGRRGGPPFWLPAARPHGCLALFLCPLAPFLLGLRSPLSPWGSQRHCLSPRRQRGLIEPPPAAYTHTCTHTLSTSQGKGSPAGQGKQEK
uniref:Uncharacterized protein n=1 Tax=Myotis myotis TaxID=51298 RepID=A0A7J7SRB8_MYOMY|nr:hypothetical protein mMyoMyo1_009312 [Myotis myotis]